MRQASLMPLVDPAWVDVLRAEAAKPDRSKQVISEELGVSRTAISLICAGKYSAGMNKVQAKLAPKVMALYGQQVWCPHLRDAIAPGICVTHHTAPMAKSDPTKLKHWLACRQCPQNPENQKKAEVKNAV
ncbi:MarR family transcriptional regulator [Agrobacterium sp. rho-13.3]|uniref:MarR family transcriptional regulator n=1 Tax=Agrobacterium sp. rho-13.3 TaxID=3072980 RepID=UPI002A153D43|nr:helix-turn-helix domain-containing protein [Agrobacterium sp. rho-13.3]MDX8310046.1 helix-turn-helix domain-containing protein [Agrobacterium sp. rho-13.3]